MRIITTSLALSASLLTVVSAAGPVSPLADAVKARHAAAVRALVKQGVDVNAPSGDGATALHWAAHWNDAAIADLLIRAGANVNATTDLGVTPLYLASEIGSAAMVERLLAAGAQPNLAARTGVAPLLLAARAGSLESVRALLARRAIADAHAGGQTALMWAAAQGHADVVRVLAEYGADLHTRTPTTKRIINVSGEDRGGEDAEWIDAGGSTALLFAARQGQLECARVLLDAGADVNDTAADGNSALVIAAHSGHPVLATWLLDHGANPNAAGAGYTVLHAAVLRDALDLVRASLAHGANPNVSLAKGTAVRRKSADFFLPSTLIGATPFLLAAKYASVEMMRALAAAGADPRLTTRDGLTPLMAAADADRRRQAVFSYSRPGDVIQADERQGLAAVAFLLALDADVNAADAAGNTALHVAASGQQDTIVQRLAERGARLEAKNQSGETPLVLAAAGRRGAGGDRTVALLRALGARE